MNLEKLEELLSRYGGDLTKWPAARRDEAQALIATDARAAKLRDEAVRLDALVGEVAQPGAMDAAAIGRIIAGIGNGRHHDLTLRPTRRLIAWAGAAMAAFLVVGFAAGLAIPANQGEDTLAGLMFGSSVSTTVNSGSVL